ncbi:MAG: MurR/RpiR family transcriptional regulator [Firmicutes bacterium]|nr:MurR/RpiR family transcriptional regulator [Bacillota bacterium]
MEIQPRSGKCLSRVRGMFGGMTPAEQKVAEYLISEPNKVVHSTVTELSRLTKTSEATIVKLCKKMGYKGFQELKIVLARDVGNGKERIYAPMDPGDDISSIKRKLFQEYKIALDSTMEVLDDKELARAVKAISAAKKIEFYGVGASGLVALDAQLKFARINLRAAAYVDPHVQATCAALLSSEDVAVGISYSGTTLDIIQNLQIAKEAGATTIGITNNWSSPIVQWLDIALLTSCPETTFRGAAIASRMVQLAVIDTLFLSVAFESYNETLQYLVKTMAAVANRKVLPRNQHDGLQHGIVGEGGSSEI